MTAAHRTFVLSDAHAFPHLIENALEDGEFREGLDRLVFAGDLVDRGPDPDRCFDLLERYGTEFLVGNHDQGILLGYHVEDQDKVSLEYRERLSELAAAKSPSGTWRVATCVEEVLISHGGIGQQWAPALQEGCAGDVYRFTDYLNDEYSQAVALQLGARMRSRSLIMEWCAPHRFRPCHRGCQGPLEGVRQIAGHNAPTEEFGAAFYMIDPIHHRADPEGFRYAVVELGQVDIRDAARRRAAHPDRHPSVLPGRAPVAAA